MQWEFNGVEASRSIAKKLPETAASSKVDRQPPQRIPHLRRMAVIARSIPRVEKGYRTLPVNILPSFPATRNLIQPQQSMQGVAADNRGLSSGHQPFQIVTGAADRNGLLTEQNEVSELSLNSILDYALYYRKSAWSVIPQATGMKAPLVRWKEFQNRIPTEGEMRSWWTKWPEAGICLILGAVSGIVAVDTDSVDAQKVFLDRLGGVPATLTVRSGSGKPGKFHHYFRDPGFRTAARYTPWHPQMEFRGAGGYIVIPPSVHRSGHRYEWVDPTVPIAEMPSVLAEAWRANPRFIRPLQSMQQAARRQFGNSPVSLRRLLLVPGLSRFTGRFLQGDFAHESNWNIRLFAAAADLAGLGLTHRGM